MSACALGCDDLFERSYVYVSAKGEIEINTASMIGHEDLRQYAQTLEGRICTAHNSETEVFFRWHREHLRRFAT
jgi:hypothetical protein